MRRLSGLLSLPGAVAVGWWILDHLLPDLLPTVPHLIAVPLVICAAIIMAAAWTAMGWRTLYAKVPRPWFPRPFWRLVYWLRHRPTVSIFQAVPQTEFGPAGMEECTITLTVWRNLHLLPEAAVVHFNASVLTLRKGEDRRARTYQFRPRDAGGFLESPVAGKTTDSVLIEFVATMMPAPIPEAPDFSTDYQLELSGVTIEVIGQKLNGVLPSSRWQTHFDSHRLLAIQTDR